MRKILIVCAVLAVFAMAISLVGCPSQSDSPEQGSPATPDPTESPDDQLESPPGEEDTGVSQKPDTWGDVMGRIDMPQSYELTVETENQSHTQVVLLEDHEPVKMKMSTKEGTMYIDYENKNMYVYSPADNTAMKMPLKQDVEENVEQDVEWAPDEYDTDARIVGSETVDGVECWIVETTSDDQTAKSWISKENGLPQKVKTDDQELSLSYDRINQISRDEFELPEDAEILDFGDMGRAGQ